MKLEHSSDEFIIEYYQKPNGELKIDYTILARDCSKIIPTLNYNEYVFKNNEGKYGLK